MKKTFITAALVATGLVCANQSRAALTVAGAETPSYETLNDQLKRLFDGAQYDTDEFDAFVQDVIRKDAKKHARHSHHKP
jgi:hypothetical protein